MLKIMVLGYVCCYINKQQKPLLTYIDPCKWGTVDLEPSSHGVKTTASLLTQTQTHLLRRGLHYTVLMTSFTHLFFFLSLQSGLTILPKAQAYSRGGKQPLSSIPRYLAHLSCFTCRMLLIIPALKGCGDCFKLMICICFNYHFL